VREGMEDSNSVGAGVGSNVCEETGVDEEIKCV
jgi:hypothetical protein